MARPMSTEQATGLSPALLVALKVISAAPASLRYRSLSGRCTVLRSMALLTRVSVSKVRIAPSGGQMRGDRVRYPTVDNEAPMVQVRKAHLVGSIQRGDPSTPFFRELTPVDDKA